MFEIKYSLYTYLVLFIILISILVGYITAKEKNHYRIKTGKKILKKIRTFEQPNIESKIINYLRKIDPFTFEELLLTAFKESGCTIKRNKRYTGDGGIDGRFKFKGDKYYIQAKRYKGYIKKSDVIVFSNKCYNDNVNGLFIHTGKSVDVSKYDDLKLSNIVIINPEELVVFILKGNIKISNQ